MLGISTLLLIITVVLYAINAIISTPERDFRYGAFVWGRRMPAGRQCDAG